MDFRFYYQIISLLDQLGIASEHHSPQEALPRSGTVLTTHRERRLLLTQPANAKVEIISVSHSLKSQEQLLSHLTRNGKTTTHEEVIIGIDPGKHIGVYVEADGVELTRFVTTEISYLEEYLRGLFLQIPAVSYKLKIGDGTGMLDVLRKLSPGILVRLTLFVVNESRTSSIFKSQNLPRVLKNGLSAREIAHRIGTHVIDVDAFLKDGKLPIPPP